MNVLKKLIKGVIKLTYAATRFNWLTFLKLWKKEASVVIYLSLMQKKSITGGEIIWDLGYINGLIKNGCSFNLRLNIGNLRNKKILWSPYKGFDHWKFSNYTNTLIHISSQLESKGNKVYPGSSEIAFLENKAYMQLKFRELKIKHPKTYILEEIGEIEKINIKFPVLIKGEHSAGSDDIYKIENEREYFQFFQKNNYFRYNEKIIIQELLNIRKDLRVIIVNDVILHFFWKINCKNEWKPTATRYGSKVIFGDFPYQWEQKILDVHKKLDLDMAAYDIAWDNDNLDDEPYFLEVSPRFSPNPNMDLVNKRYDYGSYKKKLLLKDSYDVKHVDIIYKIAQNYIETILMNNRSTH